MPHNSGLIAVYELNVLEDHRTLSTIFAALHRSQVFPLLNDDIPKGDCISLGVNLEFFLNISFTFCFGSPGYDNSGHVWLPR